MTDDDTLSGSDTTTVLVKDVAPVVLLAAVAMINENGVATLTGTISDPGTLDTFTLDIDWGDPLSPNNTETYTFAASETGSQTFTFTHQYLDDNPSGTSQDTYTISATVTDDDTLSGSDTTTVLVKDVAPVVLLDAVAMINENGVATLTGTISDPGTLDTFTLDIDWGDPLSPNNTETYTFAASATGTQTFTLTHQYLDDNPTATSQDTYTISVTVTDDDTLSDGDTTTVLVKNVDPVISSFASDATFEDKAEEGEPVNIFGEFTDIGTLDTHTAVVDWGDGSALETVTVIQGAGSGTIEGSHAYTSGGIYTITVTLTDDDTGAVQQTTTAVVTGVGLNLGVLYIIGSAEDDMVMVEETGNGQTMVHASVIPENFRTFATADIDRIISYLCEGEDHLTIANGVTTPAIVHGGDDDDHLHSGGGLTALLGDGGDDVIIGQGGRNLLIGGTGIDDLVGGNKQDILIGGSTTDDSDDDALMAALMTWASGDDYETRAAAIIAMLTAIDDNDSDRLVGAAGLDLFFDGTDDRILGENKFEILN